MKDIMLMIEKLHQINQEIIEKDNYINNYMDIIALFETMVKDPDIIKSDAYLDFRIKYITPIEAKLKVITDLQKISIEPQAILKAPATKSRQNLVAKALNGPIPTDIFIAPKNRRLPAKKQVVKVTKKAPATAGAKTTQASNLKMNIEDTDVETTDSVTSEKQYLEFEYNDQSYYIDHQAKSLGTPPQVTYEIYNDQLELSGHLKGNQMVLLDHENLDLSQEIEIPLATTEVSASDLTLDGYLIQAE
jgi:hypothetical protein